jgi:glutathione S-transferase
VGAPPKLRFDMILHGHPLSANVHKVRLLLQALQLPYEELLVDVTKGEQKQPGFLALNPRGQLPVLVDRAADAVIYDAQAILVYLAERAADPAQWFGRTAVERAHVVTWLSFAANEIQQGLHRARVHFLLGVPMDIEAVQAQGRAALTILEGELARRSYLVADRPTLADLACYPAVGLAPQGGVSLEPYPAVRGWIDRLQRAPFFVPMAGLGAP